MRDLLGNPALWVQFTVIAVFLAYILRLRLRIRKLSDQLHAHEQFVQHIGFDPEGRTVDLFKLNRFVSELHALDYRIRLQKEAKESR